MENKGAAFRSQLRIPLLLAGMVLALGGCGGGTGGLGKLLGKNKEATPPPPPTIPVHLIAAKNLNAGNDGTASAVVLKIYHLRDARRFERAPMSAFLDQTGEQAALGSDLLASSEIVLTPGARQDLGERMSEGSALLGVVALFRAPADNRWRLVFSTQDKDEKKKKKAAAAPDITIGIHACALTTSSPTLLAQPSVDAGSLASVRCQSAN